MWAKPAESAGWQRPPSPSGCSRSQPVRKMKTCPASFSSVGILWRKGGQVKLMDYSRTQRSVDSASPPAASPARAVFMAMSGSPQRHAGAEEPSPQLPGWGGFTVNKSIFTDILCFLQQTAEINHKSCSALEQVLHWGMKIDTTHEQRQHSLNYTSFLIKKNANKSGLWSRMLM